MINLYDEVLSFLIGKLHKAGSILFRFCASCQPLSCDPNSIKSSIADIYIGWN